MANSADPKVTDDETYHPQDAIGTATRAAALTGVAGLFLASVQNTVAKENIGPLGVFTRFGRTVGLFSMRLAALGYSLDAYSDGLQRPWVEHINL